MTKLESYYNKFNEDHRLQTRHGQVEFFVTYRNILDAAANARNSRDTSDKDNSRIKILDVGAATGAYSVPLSREGFDITAVELVKKNLEVLRKKHERVKCWGGDARNMHFLPDETFDITLMLGPIYHLHTEEDRLKALGEAKRVTKKGGFIFVAYVMNEYAVIKYCFGENKIRQLIKDGKTDASFKTVSDDTDLYSYSRIEEIDSLRKKSGLERIKLFSPDGPSDYMRRELNTMDPETFEIFKQYVLRISERSDLLGAGSHLVDILKKV